ncbi:Ig-like domain-containing protein [Cystobacter fuscus]
MAQDGTLETAEDTPLEVHLPASDNGALTFSIVDAPDHGTLGEISANGFVTYTPGANYNGEDAFTFRATNPKGQSAQATVTLTITPVNDTPTLSSVANQSITAGSSTGDRPSPWATWRPPPTASRSPPRPPIPTWCPTTPAISSSAAPAPAAPSTSSPPPAPAAPPPSPSR